MNTQFLKNFMAARDVSTPLIAVQTPDPAATINLIMAQCTQAENAVPVVIWDAVRGFWTFPKYQPGLAAITAMVGSGNAQVMHPVKALDMAVKLPANSLLFVMNTQNLFKVDAFSQAVWNLRDLFKGDMRTLVLLGPAFTLPPELNQDVLILSEPLPTLPELTAIVEKTYQDAKKDNAHVPELKPEVLTRAVDAISGLAAFPAEQVTAMAITSKGLDVDSMWERKRTQIEQTPGLQVWRGGEKLSDVKDADNLIGFLRKYLKNVSGILFIDEIEKAVAGAKSDSSGVSQKMHGTLLSYMEDRKAKGILLVGFPGTGKSMSAKAAGSAEGKPVIRFDMAAMENALVGKSTEQLSNALKVVDAVAQGRVLIIATCNDLAALSPELRSRFKQGTFFFDLPSPSGRADLWAMYIKAHGLRETALTPSGTLGFDSTDWTGREISSCCELAKDLGVSLKEAARFIVPVSKSAPDTITALRAQAEGRYISASHEGLYSAPSLNPGAATGRAVRVISNPDMKEN